MTQKLCSITVSKRHIPVALRTVISIVSLRRSVVVETV